MQARRSAHKRAQAELAHAHWRVVRLQLAVRLWRDFVADGAPARQRLQEQMCEHKQQVSARLLRHVWDAWQERHRCWLVRKVLMGRAVVHCGLALRRRAFAAWAKRAQERSEEQRRFCAALMHWRHRKCTIALRTWRQWLGQRANKRCASESMFSTRAPAFSAC